MAIEHLSRLIQQRGTKAACEGYTATLEEGALAYATDTSEIGIYTNGAWVWIGGGGSGAEAFTDLSDVPAAYTGAGGKFVAVNSGATALEFVTLSGGGDMAKATYDADDDGSVDKADSIDGVAAAGNSKYYGTNSGGTAGFYDLPTSGGGYDYILITEEQTQNTSAGTFTTGDWRTRTLNQEKADTGNHAALASNQITLAAGTYRCRITCPAKAVRRHQARLQNITDGSTLLTGTSEFSISGTTYPDQGISTIVGRFTLAAEKVLEIQHRCEVTVADTGFGVAANFGTEVYTVAEFWREA